MTGLLLDTNALIWLATGLRMGPQAKTIVSQAEVVYISSLSVFELRIKQSHSKFELAQKVIDSLKDMQISVLPLTVENLSNYKIYSPDNRDPFDNAIISVAISENITLVTSDKDIIGLNHPGLTCINARK